MPVLDEFEMVTEMMEAIRKFVCVNTYDGYNDDNLVNKGIDTKT